MAASKLHLPQRTLHSLILSQAAHPADAVGLILAIASEGVS
jgi:hypothetical protein